MTLRAKVISVLVKVAAAAALVIAATQATPEVIEPNMPPPGSSLLVTNCPPVPPAPDARAVIGLN